MHFLLNIQIGLITQLLYFYCTTIRYMITALLFTKAFYLCILNI